MDFRKKHIYPSVYSLLQKCLSLLLKLMICCTLHVLKVKTVSRGGMNIWLGMLSLTWERSE